MTLKVRHLTAGYEPGNPVVSDVNFSVAPGTLTAVLGPSGAGKTTLLRSIVGLHRPDHGEIWANDTRLDSLATHRRGIGLVPQEGALFPHLTVAENVAYGLARNTKQKRIDSHRRVESLLETVAMSEYAAALPHELSGGQQQRVALARALAPAPRMLLLDEPFSSLDAGLRSTIRSAFVQIVREQRIPAVLITHDQEEALAISDQLVLMHRGCVRQVGTPLECYNQPQDVWAAEFLGACTLLLGNAAGDSADTPLGSLPLLRPARGDVTVVLRPEQMYWSESGAGIAVTVIASEFYGHDQLWELRTESGLRLFLRDAPDAHRTIGSQQTVKLVGPFHWIPKAGYVPNSATD